MAAFRPRKITKAPAVDGPRHSERDSAGGSRSTFVWQSLALRPAAIQPKPAVDQAGAAKERKTDQVAGPTTRVYRSAAGPTASSDAAQTPAAALQVSPSSGGRPLDHATRASIEKSFGRALPPVQIHTGAEANAAAGRVGAQAFTRDDQIAFRDGLYAPETSEGKRLLAHELTHVVQQSDGLTRDRQPLALEDHADAVAARVTAGASAADLFPERSSPSKGAPTLQRDPDPRAQEAERAAAEMWGVVNDINALDAEVEFTYYTSNGAMTLVSFKQTKPGGKSASTLTLDHLRGVNPCATALCTDLNPLSSC